MAALSDGQRRGEEARLDHALRDCWASGRWAVVLAALPRPDEPACEPALGLALAAGLHLGLARTDAQGQLEFGLVKSLDGPWVAKPGGLREPLAGAPAWTPGLPTLVLVPGLGFAAAPAGGVTRLGRGRGTYDRWLLRHRAHAEFRGLGFSCQTRAWLPSDPWDVPLDAWWDGAVFRTA